MLGLFGLMAVLMTLISGGFYWISWDLQPRESRPSFVRKTCDDFVDLVGKCRSVVWTPERRQRAGLPHPPEYEKHCRRRPGFRHSTHRY